MTYDMTPFSNTTNIVGMFGGINEASGNILGYLTMFAVFVVLVMIMLRFNPPAESILAAGFVSAIVSLLFLSAGIINIAWFVGFVIITAGAAIAIYTNR